jgi:hypothetical protein
MNRQNGLVIELMIAELIACGFCMVVTFLMVLYMGPITGVDSLGNNTDSPVVEAVTVQSVQTFQTPTATLAFTLTPTRLATLARTPIYLQTLPATQSPNYRCQNNSAFVADVTVSDGTAFAIGQTYNKIWRLRNTGTCTWGNGYTFTFVRGDLMGPTSVISVPNTVPGTTADLLIPMVAPLTPGVHTGYWRLCNPSGACFGATLYVMINVVAPVQVPSAVPSVPYFTASATTIRAGASTTLYWGLVSNADCVTIDNGIGLVATSGSITVSPVTTTIYTLYADCGSNAQIAQVIITVVPLPATPTVTPTLAMTAIPAPTAIPTEISTATATPMPTGYVP